MKIRLLTILLGVLLLTGCSNEDIFLAGRDLWYPSGDQLNPVSSNWGIDVATSTIPAIYGSETSGDNLTLYSNPYQDGKIFLGANTWLNEPINQFVIGLDPDTYGFQDYNVPLMVAGYQNTYYGLNVFNLLDGDSASAVIVAATSPTSYVTLGQASMNNSQPEYGAMTGGSSFLMTADSDLYVGAGGTTSSTGNVYLVSGGLSDPDNVRLSLAYNGNVGIGLGKTLADFPLQVSGRARFNDSIGVDTDPSTFGIDLRGSINYVGSMKPVNAMTATLAGVAGNIDNGTHKYKITYYTDLGETGISALSTNITITDKTTDGQVNLANIPVSTDTKVTGRRIYRTLANSTASYFLLADIPNNTSTTYTDNTADADLGLYDNSNRDNTTRGRLRIDGNSVGFFGDYNTGIGLGSLGNGVNIPGYYNFALGNFALYKLYDGVQNTALGAFAGLNIVDGTSNMLAGFNSGRTMVSANGNSFYGVNTGYKATGNHNTLFGFDAGYRLGTSDAWALTTGSFNLFMGYQSGLGSATQRDYATAIGYKARVDKDYGIVLGGTGTDIAYVGIGTTTPQYNLDVNGTFGVTGTSTLSNTNILGNLDATGNINADGVFKIRDGQALSIPDIGTNNLFVGNGGQSLVYVGGSSASLNASLGYNALYSLTYGQRNLAMGAGALHDLTSAIGNIGIGSNAGYKTLTGSNNTYVGQGAGFSNVTGTLNVFIGNEAGYNENGSNKLYISNSDTATPLIYGDFASSSLKVNGSLEVTKSFTLPYIEKTANYTLTANDYTVNCTTGTFKITLPTAVGIQGRIYNIKNTGTGTITVTPNKTETIDGNTNKIINKNENLQIQSTNAGWIIL